MMSMTKRRSTQGLLCLISKQNYGLFVDNMIMKSFTNKSQKMTQEDNKEMAFIHKINQNIFGNGLIGQIGLRFCKCGKLMEWHNNQWYCSCESQKMKKINPRECQYYRKGYCCSKETCKLDCRQIWHCNFRQRCHVKIESDTKCISFIPLSEKTGK